MAEHVRLGYASTIHGAQGATVDTTHTVLTGTETRQGLYVALSRGRESNHLYLATPSASLDSVGPEVQDTVVEPRQVFTDILTRDGRALSATTVEHGDSAGLLREAVLAYQDALTVLAQHHLGPEQMAALDDALETWLPGLTQAPVYPHLRGQLALRWADGTRPETVVQEATLYRGKRTLSEAEDPAAALTWRISALTPLPHEHAPLPWLPDIPPALRQEPGTSTYLDRLTGRIDDLKHRVTDQAQQAGASDRVPWQRMLPPDVDDQLLGDLAVWRAAYAIPPTEPRPTGAPVKDPDVARHQTRLTRRLNPPSPPRGRPMEGTAGERLRASQRQAEQHARYGHPSGGARSIPVTKRR